MVGKYPRQLVAYSITLMLEYRRDQVVSRCGDQLWCDETVDDAAAQTGLALDTFRQLFNWLYDPPTQARGAERGSMGVGGSNMGGGQ